MKDKYRAKWTDEKLREEIREVTRERRWLLRLRHAPMDPVAVMLRVSRKEYDRRIQDELTWLGGRLTAAQLELARRRAVMRELERSVKQPVAQP